MAAALLRFAHACQVALCCYGGYQSYLAITNLQKYEQTTKKLAKWSQQVDEQLRKTQTTQASGAAAVFASLLASSILTFVPPSTLPVWLHFCISPALLVGVFFARGHMQNYWAPSDGKTVGIKLPLPNMEGYNEAQLATQNLLQMLQWLEYSWVAGTLGEGLFGAR
ncbi:hypothetical protein KC345_g2814 [Hortaea werneckii]|nr:hypothetical protein KC345_g2814 [Hortaea werneckii]